MFRLGNRSKACLATCHPGLQEICELAIQRTPIDFGVVQGYRDEQTQNDLFARGLSKVQWPNSKHNSRYDGGPERGMQPYSLAIDFVPWPVDWKDTHAFAVIAGVLMSTAIELGYELRWGGDWDRDGQTRDQSFMDWGHLELVL